MRKKFEKLLEPHHIGQVKTRNRIIKTGSSLNFWYEGQLHMTKQCLSYYEAIAKGGVGLLIVEAPGIDYPYGVRWRERYRFDDDKYIGGMRELVDVIHKYNCPTFLQLQHDGPLQSPLFPDMPKLFEGPPIGSSPVKLDCPGDLNNDVPRELTIPEIEELVNKFAAAAVRAQKTGFDGVDINAASTHLIHNFISPFWNRRRDKYGGSRKNRIRFLLEIVSEIKKLAGKDFPVSVILNGIERGSILGIDDSQCLNSEDVIKNAHDLELVGADAIMIRSHWLGHLVGGFFPDYLFYPEPPIPLKSFPKEYYWKKRGSGSTIFLADRLKKAISIPVTIVGRITPELGEKFLLEKRSDFIGMTRALLCDPEMPNKLAAGNSKDIRPCTACGTCIEEGRCRLNAFLGKHEPYELQPAKEKKRVVVIGSGPGGMEAARVAAERGHDVIIYDKSNKLGGLLPTAGVVKGLEQEDLTDIIRYFKGQFVKLGVKVKLGRAFDDSILEEIKPDVVIVATGGEPTIPDITGINMRHVIKTSDLHSMLKFFLKFFEPKILGWLTKFWIPIGKRVVVIGSGLHGCEVAEFLVKRRRSVIIVDTVEEIGEGMINFSLGQLLKWFGQKGVTIFSGVKSLKIIPKGVTFISKKGERQIIEVDNVIPTRPLTSNAVLYEKFEGKVSELYAVGDCINPRMIVDAVADGFNIARSI